MDIITNNMFVYKLEVFTPYKWSKHLEIYMELFEFFPFWVEFSNHRLVWILFGQNTSTFTEEILNWKLHFLCSAICARFLPLQKFDSILCETRKYLYKYKFLPENNLILKT